MWLPWVSTVGEFSSWGMCSISHAKTSQYIHTAINNPETSYRCLSYLAQLDFPHIGNRNQTLLAFRFFLFFCKHRVQTWFKRTSPNWAYLHLVASCIFIHEDLWTWGWHHFLCSKTSLHHIPFLHLILKGSPYRTRLYKFTWTECSTSITPGWMKACSEKLPLILL